MVWRMIRYECRRCLPLYAVWAAIGAALAAAARLGLFSLTDMPLFYLLFFGSVGILLYRYHCTMHSSEAAFLFTLDLSPGKQMLARYGSSLLWSIFTALAIGGVLFIQGEALSGLLRQLSFPMGILLTAEVSLSVFTLVVFVSVPLTLSHMRPFSGHPVFWFLILGAALLGAVDLLSGLTECLIPAYLAAAEDGRLFVTSVPDTPASISFSVNMLLWDTVFAGVILLWMPRIVRRKLLLTR